MTNEQIFGILGQGLDIATQKGVFNLGDAKLVADALNSIYSEYFTLNKVY